MPLKLNSTGGGAVSLDSAVTGSTFTLIAPANNSTLYTTSGGPISGDATFNANVLIGTSVAKSTLTTNGAITLANVPFIEMTNVINYNYTINSGMNALTPGPVSVANGVSVTVPDGSYWSVT